MVPEPVTKKLTQTATEIETTIFALYRLLRRPFDADAAGSGLTVPQITVLEELANEDGLSLKELSRRLSLSHSTVSGIIDRLEKRELVQRTTDAQDRRASRILLSPSVRAYIREVVPSRRLGPLLGALQAASPEARHTILAGLRTLKGLMEASPRA
jgi:DNA-binding MarR family transcriptional regulator